MRIKMICDCGANQFIKTDGGADEAIVQSVIVWIRMHSLHGMRLVGEDKGKVSANPRK